METLALALATSQQEFSDADFRVVDNADQSKKLAFEVSGVTAATTRTMTVPDASGTLMLTSAIGTTVLGYDALLAAIAALTTAAGGFIRTSGVDTVVAQAIVGTVSQSGGNPTGALFELGSGSNGLYARFANGSQICSHTLAAGNVDVATGSVFRSATFTWTFPAAFSVAPAVSPCSASISLWGSAAVPSTTACGLRLLSPVTIGTSQDAQVIAVGRWF
jgi:hypothetical protein